MTADMSTVDELVAATEANPESTPIDVLSDWYQKLIDSRAVLETAKAEEKEAKEHIQELLAEHGAKLGLLNGVPVVEMKTGPRRSAPSLKVFDAMTQDIAAAIADMIAELLAKLKIQIVLPVGPLTKALRTATRKVLDDYTSTSEVTTLETKKFLPDNK